ncbi:hypothetical protein JOQ06_011267, partial [Pogonophryne albipinna]
MNRRKEALWDMKGEEKKRRKMIEGIGRGGGREVERRVSGWRLGGALLVEERWYAVALGKQVACQLGTLSLDRWSKCKEPILPE